MALYDQVGGEVTLEREATFAEVVSEWMWRSASAKKAANDRIGYGMLWWGKVDGERRLFDLAYVRADGGWAEIDDARRALMGDARYREASGMPV
jgi:hypothetical protein